jgi:hypothetical protein
VEGDCGGGEGAHRAAPHELPASMSWTPQRKIHGGSRPLLVQRGAPCFLCGLQSDKRRVLLLESVSCPDVVPGMHDVAKEPPRLRPTRLSGARDSLHREGARSRGCGGRFGQQHKITWRLRRRRGVVGGIGHSRFNPNPLFFA